MQTPYSRVLINQDGIAATVTKIFEVQYNNADVENANSPEAWWCYFGGENVGAGTLDAELSNLPPVAEGTPVPTYQVEGGAPIANMTQVVAAGPANAKNDLKYCEVIGGRVKIVVTPSAAPVAGKATVVLMANRPFNIRDVTP